MSRNALMIFKIFLHFCFNAVTHTLLIYYFCLACLFHHFQTYISVSQTLNVVCDYKSTIIVVQVKKKMLRNKVLFQSPQSTQSFSQIINSDDIFSWQKWYGSYCILFHRNSDLQNGWGWRGPLNSSSPTPLLKQGHPEQIAQDHVQTAFDYLQEWRLHSLRGQPAPLLSHPYI